MKDYYYLLGLESSSSKEDIVKAYRKLSLKFHPDLNDGDKYFEERFKDIKEAYDILSSDYKRGQYDQRIASDKRKPFDETTSNYNSYPESFERNNGQQHASHMSSTQSFEADSVLKSARNKAIKNLLILIAIAVLVHFLIITFLPSRLQMPHQNSLSHKNWMLSLIDYSIPYIIGPIVYCGWKVATYLIHSMVKNTIVFANVIFWICYQLIKFWISLCIGFICLPFYILLNLIIIITPTLFIKNRAIRFIL